MNTENRKDVTVYRVAPVSGVQCQHTYRYIRSYIQSKTARHTIDSSRYLQSIMRICVNGAHAKDVHDINYAEESAVPTSAPISARMLKRCSRDVIPMSCRSWSVTLGRILPVCTPFVQVMWLIAMSVPVTRLFTKMGAISSNSMLTSHCATCSLV